MPEPLHTRDSFKQRVPTGSVVTYTALDQERAWVQIPWLKRAILEKALHLHPYARLRSSKSSLKFLRYVFKWRISFYVTSRNEIVWLIFSTNGAPIIKVKLDWVRLVLGWVTEIRTIIMYIFLMSLYQLKIPRFLPYIKETAAWLRFSTNDSGITKVKHDWVRLALGWVTWLRPNCRYGLSFQNQRH